MCADGTDYYANGKTCSFGTCNIFDCRCSGACRAANVTYCKTNCIDVFDLKFSNKNKLKSSCENACVRSYP